MRPLILIGSAITAAVLTMIADVVGGVVGANQVSVDKGVVTRTLLVVAALAVTAVFWWLRMRAHDRPEALFLGLVLGWLLNTASWGGGSFAGQLIFQHPGVASAVGDLLAWAIVSFALVTLLGRTSAVNAR